jgi:hypothetical protein
MWEREDSIVSDSLVDEYYQAHPKAPGGPLEPVEKKGISQGKKSRHRRV